MNKNFIFDKWIPYYEIYFLRACISCHKLTDEGFRYYADCFASLHTAVKRGRPAPHKAAESLPEYNRRKSTYSFKGLRAQFRCGSKVTGISASV